MTWVLHVAAGVDDVNRHLAQLRDAGMLGTAEVAGGTDVYCAERVDGLELTGEWERVEDQDWHAQWQARMTPVTAGPWTVTPSWHATGAPDEIVIDPGQAFGTGHHETTAGCLRALADLPLDGRRVLDLGTGTGVLAIAAARRGASVVAVDIDPLAVQATQVNARRNDVRLDVRSGDPDVVAGERFEVVLANLTSAVLTQLAPTLAGLLGPDGTLVASGIGNERATHVIAALREAGLLPESSPGAEWTLIRATVAGT